jgi:hypothetical protein
VPRLRICGAIAPLFQNFLMAWYLVKDRDSFTFTYFALEGFLAPEKQRTEKFSLETILFSVINKTSVTRVYFFISVRDEILFSHSSLSAV